MKPIAPLRSSNPPAWDTEFRTHETDRIRRGDFSEQIVERRLTKLKRQGMIRRFRKYDRSGIDYLIQAITGRWLPIQVKTSRGGAFHHRQRYGSDIPVVVTNDHMVRQQILGILVSAGAL